MTNSVANNLTFTNLLLTHLSELILVVINFIITNKNTADGRTSDRKFLRIPLRGYETLKNTNIPTVAEILQSGVGRTWNAQPDRAGKFRQTADTARSGAAFHVPPGWPDLGPVGATLKFLDIIINAWILPTA